MAALLDEGRRLLRHPDLADADRADVERGLRGFDDWQAGARAALLVVSTDPTAARSASAIHDDYVMRVRTAVARAGAIGITPYASAGMHDLLDEGRQILQNPDLPEPARTDIERGLRGFRDWQAAVRAALSTATADPPAARSAAVIHNEYASRARAAIEQAAAIDISPFASAEMPALLDEGRKLLQHPDLPRPARADIERALHGFATWQADARAAIAVEPEGAGHRRPAGAIYNDYADRVRSLVDRAVSIDVSPFSTPGMRALLEEGRRLLQHPDLPETGRADIQRGFLAFRRWQADTAKIAADPDAPRYSDAALDHYRDYRQRLHKFLNTGFERNPNDSSFVEKWELIKQEGRELLEFRDLPAPASAWVERRIDIAHLPLPDRDYDAPLPGRLSPRLENLIADHGALLESHAAIARQLGILPRHVNGWGHLENAGRMLSGLAQFNNEVRAPEIRALLDIYRACRLPDDDPSQSRSISHRQSPGMRL